ncbi:MAG: hypothetical protein WC505_07785 [Patescibacteria group bacterium]
MIKKVMVALPVIAAVALLSACTATDNSNTEVTAANSESTSAMSNTNAAVASELVGSWQTDCLIPDMNSPWAEQHFFTFDTGGAAQHKRVSYYEPACTGSGDTMVDNYTYSLPGANQIDLIDIEKDNTINDLYQLTGSELRFGHGYRNDTTSENKDASGRITTLNNFIVYGKVE